MRYIITHGHIFKNAGTTFDSALEKAFGKDFCDHRDDKAMRRGGAEYLKQYILDNPNLKAISSHHLCNPLPESEEFKCIPVYFVRNPIERIISVYNFERKQKTGTLGAEMAAKMTLDEYVRWRFSPEAPKVISNFQTATIGKDAQYKAKRSVEHDIFMMAMKRVLSNEVLVGVVEEFDSSFTYISNELEHFFPNVKLTYKRKNTSDNRAHNSKFYDAVKKLGDLLPEVIENNSYDLALWETIRENHRTLSNYSELKNQTYTEVT